MGIVTFTLILEAALRIELIADLHGCGQRVDRTIKGINGHSMPQVGIIARPEAVSQGHGFVQDITENSPGYLLPSSRDPTAVDCFGIRPESTALRTLEELARFDVHSSALSAGGKEENEDNQLGEGELAVTRKVVCRLFVHRVEVSRDQL